MLLKQITALAKRYDGHGLLGTGAAMSVVRVVNIISGIGLAVLLARGLGAEGYGQYIFALTLVNILSLPIQMGLPTLLVRQVAIYRSQADWGRLVGIMRWSVLFVSIMLGIIALAAVAYYALNPTAKEQPIETYLLYFLAFLLAGKLGYMQVTSAMLGGFERVLLRSIPDGMIRPLGFLALIFGVQFFIVLSPSWVMGLHALAGLIALIWAVFMFRRHCLNENKQIKGLGNIQFYTRDWLASLLPLSFIAGATIINSKLDIFMLGFLSSKTNVGLYSVALQIAGTILIGQTIVNAIIGPKIARMYASGDIQELQKLISHACRLTSLLAVTCFLIIIVFGQLLIEIVFGMDFSSSYNITLITCAGFAFSAIMGPVVLTLNMAGHERTTMWVVAFSAVVNALLNIFLIPRYGAEGAAVATLITVVVIQSVLSFAVRKKTDLRCSIAAALLPSRPAISGV